MHSAKEVALLRELSGGRARSVVVSEERDAVISISAAQRTEGGISLGASLPERSRSASSMTLRIATASSLSRSNGRPSIGGGAKGLASGVNFVIEYLPSRGVSPFPEDRIPSLRGERRKRKRRFVSRRGRRMSASLSG